MTPYYSDEAVTIYHGDCRDVLPSIGKVDLVLTDPPYACSSDSDDHLDERLLDLVAATVRDGGGLFCFCGQATIDIFMARFRASGLTWLNTIAWHYDNTICRERKRFGIGYDPILFYSRGKLDTFNMDTVRVPYKSCERLKYIVNSHGKAWHPHPLGAIRKDVWAVPAITSPTYSKEKLAHKWQKPKAVIEPMVLAATKSGDLVLDPFVGSGTTLEVAAKLGRKSIGIEIEEKYCEIAANRCRQMVML